jgi:Ca2+-transporting ATPase
MREVPVQSTAADVSGWRGLAVEEALRRLVVAGPNELPRPPRRGPLRVLREVLAEPMFLLLVLAAAIYAALGDLAEGALLGAFALLTIGLTVLQQTRSERALEALRALGAPRARVIRDARTVEIPAREVVIGDLLLIGEGERIAADAMLRRCDGLSVDESLLTGESVPVRKRAADGAGFESGAPGGEDRPEVFAGTLAVAGHGIAQVRATGVGTAAGRIGLSLAGIESGPSPLQRAIARLVRLFGLVAIGLSAAVVVLYASWRGDWVEGALAGIALAMSMLPEEFPMVLLVFLALGAWRLAQVRVLARRIAVIETLGAASALCVDKTGTLTENRMRLAALVATGETLVLSGSERTLPESMHRVLEYGVLASKRRAVDPMEAALHSVAHTTLAASEHLHADWPLEREYGLTPTLPALARVWRRADGGLAIAAKGAPEAVARLCGFDPDASAAMLGEVERLAARGWRVLAVASGELVGIEPPPEPSALPLRFEGLLAFVDPLRREARAAVAEAARAGVSVAMITGDYPATALAIAREAGIAVEGGVLTGAAIEALEDAALADAMARVRVFARIRPEQKLRLVEALKARGEVVAMTGDGVNDAPALKAAHIGLAMGARGTDVAREAAGIVLLEDDLGHILSGIRTGRRIFANLRKVMIYIAAIHLPVAGLALLPLLVGLPPLLLPMHVVLIEMVVDPICSIAFESTPEDPDLMRRPPRPREEPLLGAAQLGIAMLQGALLLAACAALYASTLASGVAVKEARTLAFVCLTAGNLALVRVNTTRESTLMHLFDAGHRAYWLVAALASAVVALCIAVPALARLFGFVSCEPASVLGAVVLGIGAALAFDLVKPLTRVQRILGAAAR